MTKMISDTEQFGFYASSHKSDLINDTDIKVQVYYAGVIMVVYIKDNLRLEETLRIEQLFDLMRQICELDAKQPFTIKWVDEEGDPCTINSQLELDEAVRLYYINKETELILHVFPNRPEKPGYQCSGEDRSIYRRGARRWRKFYLVNGHKYQAKRFARTALCRVCNDKIWGLGRQGYKCLECKIMVHKRCHRFISLQCDDIIMEKYLQMNPHLKFTRKESSKKSFSNKISIESTHSGQSPLSKCSSNSSNTNHNNLVPISYNELEVNDLSYSKSSDDDEDFAAYNNKSITKASDIKSLASNLSKKLHLNKQTSAKTTNKQMSLQDFDLIKVIGRGSYAKVFLVEYKRNRKCYAMKVIKKSKVNDDEDIDWVQTEKHIFEQATNHPFLVGLHSCFQTESNLFFVIEYLCGGDLMYHMQRKCKLPEDHARFYSAEIALALDFLHTRGIIYRDLKLDNVLLDIEGHIKLTDYGMCKEGLKKGEQTSTFCGTPNYIAPEMLRGESYDFSIDWWALGVICFEMMAGRTPFNINENASENPDLNTEDHLFQVILEKPIRIPRNLSVKATSILKGFLQKAPSDRLGSQDGLREIKQHSFYQSIDWTLLEQRLIQPPYKPVINSEHDISNIDELFTKEEVCLTPESPGTLACIQQNEFEGFEYVNPLILSEELSV